MSDVVLFFPKTGYDIKNASVELPLSMLSLASVLVDDYDVRIIDQRVDEQWEQKLEKELAKKPYAFTFSAMTGTQITNALALSKRVQEGGSKAIWGGIHATILPYQTVEHPNVDYVIVGEGEFTLKAFVDAQAKGGEVKDIPNLVYKGKDRSGLTAQAPISEPSDIPELPYHLVDVENYVKSGGMTFARNERILPFITSRGCPYRCGYCSTGFLAQKRWKYLSADEAVERVMRIKRRYHLDVVKFYDENFLTNPVRAEAIARGLNDQIKWSIQARMDNLLRVNIKTLEAGGLRVVEPGVESGSDRILQLVNKDENVATMVKANQKLAETNVKAFYNFMMGFPTETKEEIMQTIDFALQLLKDNKNAHVTGFYIYSPYPGTSLFTLAVQHGFTMPDTLEGWAEFSRQQQLTPWIQDRIDMLNSIMYGAKFVDGKRMRYILRNTPIAPVVIPLLGWYFRRKWRQHDFRDTMVIKSLQYVSNKVMN